MEEQDVDIALYTKIDEHIKNKAIIYTKTCKANKLDRDTTLKELIEHALEFYISKNPVKAVNIID